MPPASTRSNLSGIEADCAHRQVSRDPAVPTKGSTGSARKGASSAESRSSSKRRCGSVASRMRCMAVTLDEVARVRSLIPALAAALAATCIALAPAAAAQTGAAALRATYEKLAPNLANSPLGRPMVLSSSETPNGLKGEVYGVLDHPLAKVNAALDKPAHWCAMLLLHLNNLACLSGPGKQTLTLSVVRRYDIPVDQAFELTFRFHIVSAKPDYFDAKLNSGKGPFGTRNYRVSVEGIPLENGKSFI